MEKISFHCSHCGKRISAPSRMVGRQAPCPSCKKVILVEPPKGSRSRPRQASEVPRARQTASVSPPVRSASEDAVAARPPISPGTPPTSSAQVAPPLPQQSQPGSRDAAREDREQERGIDETLPRQLTPDAKPAPETSAAVEESDSVDPETDDSSWYGTWYMSSTGFKIGDVRDAMGVCTGRMHSVEPAVSDSSVAFVPRSLHGHELRGALASGFVHLALSPFRLAFQLLAFYVGLLIVAFLLNALVASFSETLAVIVMIVFAVFVLLATIYFVAEFLWGIWSMLSGGFAWVLERPFVFRCWDKFDCRDTEDVLIQFTREEPPQVLRLDVRRSFARKVADLIEHTDNERRADVLSWLIHLGLRIARLPFLIIRFVLESIFGARGDQLSIFLFVTGERLNLKGIWRDFTWMDTLSDIGKSNLNSFHYLTLAPRAADTVQRAIESSLNRSVKVFDEESAIDTFLLQEK